MYFIVFIFLVVTCTQAVEKQSYQVRFPWTNHVSYAKYEETISKPLEALTLCLWERPFNQSTNRNAFSYSVAEGFEIHLQIGIRGAFGVDTSNVFWDLPPYSNLQWIHYCVTWSLVNGTATLYRNGEKELSPSGLKVGHKIQTGGIVILGQDQNKPGGIDNPGTSWRGDISEVHVWDHIICENQIKQLANCNSNLQGNVLSWLSSVLSLETVGDVSVQPVFLCQAEECTT